MSPAEKTERTLALLRGLNDEHRDADLGPVLGKVAFAVLVAVWVVFVVGLIRG